MTTKRHLLTHIDMENNTAFCAFCKSWVKAYQAKMSQNWTCSLKVFKTDKPIPDLNNQPRTIIRSSRKNCSEMSMATCLRLMEENRRYVEELKLQKQDYLQRSFDRGDRYREEPKELKNHKLTGIDTNTKLAYCHKCKRQVRIRKRTNGLWYCKITKIDTLTAVRKPHTLESIDLDNKTAFCIRCNKTVGLVQKNKQGNFLCEVTIKGPKRFKVR